MPPHSLQRSWLVASALAVTGCFHALDAAPNPGEDEDAAAAPATLPASAVAEAGAPSGPPAASSPAPSTAASEAGVAVLPTFPLPGSSPPTAGRRPVPGTDPCWGLDLEACNRTGFCVTAPAYQLDPVHGCATGDLVPLCNSLQGPLSSLLMGSVVAADGAGRTFLVPWANLPSDWQPLDPQPPYASAYFVPPACPSAATEAACARHADAPSCRGERHRSCLAKVASHFDAVAGCVRHGELPEIFLGCSGERPKTGVSYFRDAQGEVWEVPSSAIGDVPADWTAIAPSSVRPGADRPPPCFIEL